MAKKPFNKDAWLATYGDMITLVLTFFILLFSMSTIDQQKWAVIVQVFSRSDVSAQIVLEDPQSTGEKLPGSSGDSDKVGQDSEPSEVADGQEELPKAEEFQPSGATKLMEEELQEQSDAMTALAEVIQEILEKKELSDQVEVGQGEGFIIMRFEGDLFFGPDSAVLMPAGKEAIDYIMATLEPIESEIQMVRVDGHTAATNAISPSITANRKLSSDRANSVLAYMEEKNIVDPAKMIAVGYGKYRPIADNATDEGRKKNRRVEIYIADHSSPDMDIDEIYKTLAPDDNQGDTGTSSFGYNMDINEIYQTLAPSDGR